MLILGKSLLQKEGRKIFCNEEKGGRMGSLAWWETSHTSQASNDREKRVWGNTETPSRRRRRMAQRGWGHSAPSMKVEGWKTKQEDVRLAWRGLGETWELSSVQGACLRGAVLYQQDKSACPELCTGRRAATSTCVSTSEADLDVSKQLYSHCNCTAGSDKLRHAAP